MASTATSKPIKVSSIDSIEPIFPITFSVPWKRSEFWKDSSSVVILFPDGTKRLVDVSPLAFWEDGSVKWTSHSLSNVSTTHFEVVKVLKDDTSTEREGGDSFSIEEDEEILVIKNKIGLGITFNKRSNQFIQSIDLQGTQIASNGSIRASSSLQGDEYTIKQLQPQIINPITDTNEIIIEKQTSDKLVVLVKGKLTSLFDQDSTIHYKLRIYIHSSSDVLKFTNTIIYNLNSNENLRSLGLQLIKSFGDVPLHDRHIRITGSDGSLLSESCRSLTGLWQASNESVRSKQAQGLKLPDVENISEWGWDPKNLSNVVSFDEYSLTQLTSNGFQINKRSKAGYSRVKIGGGTRNDGAVFIGAPQVGGVSIGVVKFWERYPSELSIDGLTKNDGTNINIWFYSPKAEPLEVSSYHDGLGLDTYPKQIDAMHITYEDYEPGLDTPRGIGRSFEVYLKPSLPSEGIITNDEISQFVTNVRNPPVYISDLNQIYESKVFPYWKPRDSFSSSHTKKKSVIENHLDILFEYYQQEIQLNDWYGFWDYGDVMHTYDNYRHQWRYDVGGFAWDNSELSTDSWLWLYYLHTGSTKAFRIAEAMTQHTSEVDIYHLGQYKGFGTRHGVQHWSDSSKQLRISNVFYKRFYYYLSGGDERLGEILNELTESQRALLALDAHRKVQEKPKDTPDGFAISGLLDWGSLVSAWLFQWETRQVGWERGYEKLINSIESLVKLPHGFTTKAFYMNIENGVIKSIPPPTPSWAISHLSIVFGFSEIIVELIESIKYSKPELEAALVKYWTDYAIAYNNGEQEQLDRYGFVFPKERLNLKQSHARGTAYAAWYFNDSKLGEAAWHQFFHTDGYSDELVDWELTALPKNASLSGATREATWLSTNLTAQYGLSAIYLLEFVGQYLKD